MQGTAHDRRTDHGQSVLFLAVTHTEVPGALRQRHPPSGAQARLRTGPATAYAVTAYATRAVSVDFASTLPFIALTISSREAPRGSSIRPLSAYSLKEHIVPDSDGPR